MATKTYPPELADEIRALVEKHGKTAVGAALNDCPARKKGGKEIDDAEAIERAADLMVRDGLTAWAACKQVAEEIGGHSVPSTADRMHGKLKPDEGRHLAEAHRRQIRDDAPAVEDFLERLARESAFFSASGPGDPTRAIERIGREMADQLNRRAEALAPLADLSRPPGVALSDPFDADELQRTLAKLADDLSWPRRK